MSDNLDFSVVANNTVSLQINVLDADDSPVDASALGLSIKWQWFIPGRTVTKSTTDGGVTIVTSNPLVLGISILATDTIGAKEGSYPHEAVTVDSSDRPVTITNNNALLSCGVGFVRAQRTVQ